MSPTKATAGLIALLFSCVLAFGIARAGLRLIAWATVVSYWVEEGEFTDHADGHHWPSSDFFGLGNRKGQSENFPIVHDADGFTPGRVPDALLDRKLDGFTPPVRAAIESLYANRDPLPGFDAPGRPAVHLTVGDSNVRVSFEHVSQMLMPSRYLSTDALGIPHTGPDHYSYAVQRWLRPDGPVARQLRDDPTLDLEITVLLTPHNDLEDLKNAAFPDTARVFANEAPAPSAPAAAEQVNPSAPEPAAPGLSKRDVFRKIVALLRLNRAEVALLRGAVSRAFPGLLSDGNSFAPSVDDAAMRTALGHLDLIEQAMEVYVSAGRRVVLYTVVLPSIYDVPSLTHDYTWGELLEGYAAGAYHASDFTRRVDVRNLDARTHFQTWNTSDADYAQRFDAGDLHYSLRGQIELCLAMAIEKGFAAPDPWAVADERGTEERARLADEILRVHVGILERLRPLDPRPTDQSAGSS